MSSIINKSETPSILSKTFQIQGDIKSTGILEIEGRVKGSVKGNVVIIRGSGLVEAKIEAETLNVYGSFKGEIKANAVNIFKKAKVVGNIDYNSLSIEDGASIDGQFKKINSEVDLQNKVANENQEVKTRIKS